ncbi:hypothetical protein HMPREF0322_04461 [Desulfitobacterium hafniense DP7]|uniref:Uncharacterized protein n=1 Tax=Desulfitobacterium hafniense DP7 TaxID=537010 RepID=G9XU03_DESHA|nr:hypothetical protein HMPREF0322_04461 [Desulfitobacterium hafniense DP7]
MAREILCHRTELTVIKILLFYCIFYRNFWLMNILNELKRRS